jgi:NAD(P)-dependent dehydrogenase (short-subunit alcohol dehydrogenase family)
VQKRWAFVTGADRGLGLGLVKVLLARDYHVFAGQFIHDNDELALLREMSGDKLHLLPLDISDEASVRLAVDAVNAVTDQLDILINNGAILGDMKASIQDELNFDEMERVFRVNTLGSLRMSNGFIASIMRSQGKLIVNISSEAGSIGNCWRTGWYAYCMSKAALNMQSQLIHNQIAPQGGKVLVIHPGHVQTYMQGKLDTNGKLTPNESAEYIIKLCESRLHPDYANDKLELIDYAGNTLPW